MVLLRNGRDWAKKNWFSGSFWEGYFVFTLLRRTSYAQSFCQKKSFMKLHTRGKFIGIVFVVVKL